MKVNQKNLLRLRSQLNRIDRSLVALLEKRFHIAGDIAVAKDNLNLPLTDLSREQEIIERLISLAKNPLLKNTIRQLYTSIFQLSKTTRILSREKSIAFKKIGIIGLGLIGGSIVRIIKMKNPAIQIITLARESNDIHQAVKKLCIDHVIQSINQLIIDCDLIILASPIDTVIPLAKQIRQLSNNLGNQLIVIDCASVKQEIAEEFSQLTAGNVEFIPTHPMAGSEKSGFASSDISLFIGQPWIITPHEKNTESAINDIYQFIRFLGSNPMETDPLIHDRQVALMSHLGFLLSILYFEFVQKKDKNALSLAGSGFKSMTRLAAGNVSMHTQIISSNRKNIGKVLDDFISFLHHFSLDDKSLLTVLQNIKKQRAKL